MRTSIIHTSCGTERIRMEKNMVTVRGGYIAAVTPQDWEHDRRGVKEFGVLEDM